MPASFHEIEENFFQVLFLPPERHHGHGRVGERQAQQLIFRRNLVAYRD
jgi:hypothetical protein